MGVVAIGTCGYDYPGWKDVFYPPGVKRDRFLSYYAGQFDALEIHYTFHRIPDPSWMRTTADKAGPDLRLAVKAHETLTHKIDPGHWSASEFRSFLEPAMADGRLGAVLFQFPHGFRYEPDRRRYLDRLLREFESYPRVVEFRNAAWVNNRVLEGFRERGTVFGCTDTPRLGGLPPPMDVVTGNFGYVRFHGRNASSWWTGSEGERYNYIYSEQELRPWASRIRGMLARTELVYVFFNNVPFGNAPRNADMLRRMLKEGAA